MGLLGVITEVTFQCEPQFNLEETITTPPFDECIDISPQNRVDVSDKVFLVPDYFLVFSQAEIAVGITDCRAAMREVDRIVSELAITVNYIEVSHLDKLM